MSWAAAIIASICHCVLTTLSCARQPGLASGEVRCGEALVRSLCPPRSAHTSSCVIILLFSWASWRHQPGRAPLQYPLDAALEAIVRLSRLSNRWRRHWQPPIDCHGGCDVTGGTCWAQAHTIGPHTSPDSSIIHRHWQAAPFCWPWAHHQECCNAGSQQYWSWTILQ